MSFVIAIPVTYALSTEFLEDYTYRIVLSPWVFLIGVGAVFMVAMIIVGVQSRFAAQENPVDALMDE